MNGKLRINSILKASQLNEVVTGLPSFNVSELEVETNLVFQLPTNLRLGHLAEVIISESIKASANYEVLYENVQLIESKETIGELDFILRDKMTERIIHMELAYKFYLFDPSISSIELKNWIGPNRKDSLKEKLEKVKAKQFPLLQNGVTKSKLQNIEIGEISQELCLLASLYIPFEYKERIGFGYSEAIKGYYLNIDKFLSFDHSDRKYYLPEKKQWGMDPAENETWEDFKKLERFVNTNIKEERALLCWQKHEGLYSSFFIVWW